MKLRSKLLLSATCLLTISVAATATSAYAWFVSNRQATVAISKADVKTNATNLKITGASTQNGTVTAGENNKSTTIESKVTATDISGDGKTFFKPRLSPGYNGIDNFYASKIEAVTPAQNYYHEFSLQFSQTNTNVKTGVYLGKDSTVTSPTTKGELVKAARIAFSTDNFTNVKLYLAPAGVDQSYYLKGQSTTEVSLNAAKVDVVGNFDEISDPNKNNGLKYSAVLPTADVTDATSKDDKLSNTFYLGDVTGTSTAATLTVTIRIWFEGMDSNCVTKNIANDLSADLKFYGVNMDI